MNQGILKYILTGFLSLFFFSSFGQNWEDANVVEASNGHLEVIASPQVDSLLNLHLLMNEQYPNIPGYRIQIFFESGNNSKKQATDAYRSFLGKYPDQTAYISFSEPNYRVRVGDFRTKLEAENFLRQIEDDYQGAWIGSDRINYPAMGETGEISNDL